tara:strand:- start:425 stop:1168 length:744 start_codon:yes stop_codon:yes gene_type:complete
MNIKNFKQQYDQNGFFIVKNAVKKKVVLKILKEINLSRNTEIYFDRKNKIRRIEKIYNKGLNLKKINNFFLSFLNKIFGKKFFIFKDKFNAKPPGGEGFYAHYDGVFKFRDKNNKIKNGWYNYGKVFINVLLALDDSNKKNGTIELAKYDKSSFSILLENTKKDGTPNILKSVERSKKFKPIELNKGDIVIFSNTCAHRSKKNKSNINRRSLYYTYSLKKYGFNYNKYFLDKKNSKNLKSKSLSGDI